MSDRWAVALAVVTVAGARAATAVPLFLGLVLVGVALLVRRPWLLLAVAAVWASFFSARAWSGLEADLPPTVAGRATLVSDPEGAFGAVSVDVRVGGRRYEAWARGAAAETLRNLLTGEEVELSGRPRPRPPDAPWLIPRHVVGQLDVEAARTARPGAPWWQVANAVRRTLDQGAEALPTSQRALFTGLTVGDDRDQSPEVAEDFRAAGLSHLLAVSGQNVAFLLVLAGPALRQVRSGCPPAGDRCAPRLPRARHPLRAVGPPRTVMVGLATTALTAGRPVSGGRALALAVTGLVLVDPLLAWSVGFALSVGASAGISLLAPHPLAPSRPAVDCYPSGGHRGGADRRGPVLIPVFGGLPVASLPANLLAVPAAGAVMVWASAGLVAGAAGSSLARVLHVVTSALVGWVAGVARVAAAFPLEIGDGSRRALGSWHRWLRRPVPRESDGSVWRP